MSSCLVLIGQFEEFFSQICCVLPELKFFVVPLLVKLNERALKL